jgi:hypothetical protein
MSDFQMRAPCVCGNTTGFVDTRNGQDCVFCDQCRKFQYNAPKVETGREQRSLKTTHDLITPSTRAKVLLRASGRCELCGKKETTENGLHVSHLLSVDTGMNHGLTEADLNCEDNLCCLCAECNIGMGKVNMPLRLVVALLKGRKP